MTHSKHPPIPKAFLWRRFHSLMGLWLVFFLFEHLLVNARAAALFGEDGSGFVNAVNAIQALPYLRWIELSLLGIPFVVHALWGIKYLLTAKMNVWPSDGTSPSLPKYPRNYAYTLQRLTSWILLFGIIGHVVHMRFINYPEKETVQEKTYYTVTLSDNHNLIAFAEKFDAKSSPVADHPGQAKFMAPNFGTATLLMLWDTFKSPLMASAYTAFVLAAAFHALNGLWTFLIVWGVSLTVKSQNLTQGISILLMGFVSLLGGIAIWGIYFS